MDKDLSHKIGALLFEEGTDRASHFVNTYGKRQRIPEGYMYDQQQGMLVRNPKETPEWYRSRNRNEPSRRNDVGNNYADLFTSTAAHTCAGVGEEYVEFELTDKDSDKWHVIKCAERAFGLHANAARGLFNSGKRIRCRPDQFTRFLIWRAEGVSVNQFQALRAKLVTEKPVPSFIDVRGN